MKNQDLCNKIILPCCSSYDSARQIFNRSIQKCPYGILYCESEGDVADGIHFARQCGLTVCGRSGGHNYEGFCVGNGVLVLDTSRLKNRDIGEETSISQRNLPYGRRRRLNTGRRMGPFGKNIWSGM